MNLNTEPIKNWFGFTRRERRSSSVLLLFIFLILGLRYAVPDSRITLEDFTGPISAAGSGSDENPLSLKLNSDVKFSSRKPLKKSVSQKFKIDINASDSATLVRLPGIGPVLSARIIKYRHLLGGFARIDQLKEVYGLPAETYEKIKGQIFADSTSVTRININMAGYKELLRFPYFEKYEVSAILKYRELKGMITGINDLTENKLISLEKARKVVPYLKYDE